MADGIEARAALVSTLLVAGEAATTSAPPRIQPLEELASLVQKVRSRPDPPARPLTPPLTPLAPAPAPASAPTPARSC